MLYIKKTLSPKEKIIHCDKPHYIILLSFMLWIILAFLNFEYFDKIFTSILIPFTHINVFTKFDTTLFILGLSAITLIGSLLHYYCTEYVITNKRILVKTGFIQRDVHEIFLNKIEGVALSQSPLGRIMHYATIIVTGIGGTKTTFRYIANPLSFRASIQEYLLKEPSE